jgi:hypothetical protein
LRTEYEGVSIRQNRENEVIARKRIHLPKLLLVPLVFVSGKDGRMTTDSSDEDKRVLGIHLRLLTVNFASVPYAVHSHQAKLVIDLVNDAIGSYAKPPVMFTSGEFAAIGRSWIVG